MAGMKGVLNRFQKRLAKLEEHEREHIQKRIALLGYLPNEVLGTLPLFKRETRARLLIFLEFEEIHQEYAFSCVTELHYSCAFYPTIIIDYLHYLLDQVVVPPIEELDIYRYLIGSTHQNVTIAFEELERKWKARAS